MMQWNGELLRQCTGLPNLKARSNYRAYVHLRVSDLNSLLSGQIWERYAERFLTPYPQVPRLLKYVRTCGNENAPLKTTFNRYEVVE
jgi:hypothetical protein